ncbi:MAG TPA: carboxylating nicotinate-nucleotide diphosphorylase [Fimbriimonadaceae bacterium]|nr:carboxylating nicotinate-nucleotide diphosphorylase [Fimbriimonadaceae bacterium]
MSVWLQPEPVNWWHLVDDAIQEDVGSGDVTGGCIDPELIVDYAVTAHGDGIVSGVGIAEYLLAPYPSDPENAQIEILVPDGEAIQRGDRLIVGAIQARRLVMAERVLLNFLSHLCGIATLTAQYVKRIEDSGAKIVDSRKTLPAIRALQKYAVRCGGGHNHRMGLFDGAFVKDNHIRACGSITLAVERIRSYASHFVKVEVECQTMDEVEEAVEAGADIVMLDNMDPFMMREAVKRFEGRCAFEAGGGITLDTVKGVAQTGVDFISISSLTHSAPAMPINLEVT